MAGEGRRAKTKREYRTPKYNDCSLTPSRTILYFYFRMVRLVGLINLIWYYSPSRETFLSYIYNNASRASHNLLDWLTLVNNYEYQSTVISFSIWRQKFFSPHSVNIYCCRITWETYFIRYCTFGLSLNRLFTSSQTGSSSNLPRLPTKYFGERVGAVFYSLDVGNQQCQPKQLERTTGMLLWAVHVGHWCARFRDDGSYDGLQSFGRQDVWATNCFPNVHLGDTKLDVWATMTSRLGDKSKSLHVGQPQSLGRSRHH